MVTASPYVRDLLEQPAALRRTMESLVLSDEIAGIARALSGGSLSHVVLTGMGASFHALVPLELSLTQGGRVCRLVEAGELLRYMPGLVDERTLLVVASQSGRTIEVVRLLDPGPAPGALLAVTNDGDSPLARMARACVVTRAGVESTVSCKTYLATLAALEWLGAILGGGDAWQLRRDLEAAIPAIEAYLTDWPRHVEALTQMLVGVEHVFVVGRGRSRAAAGFGGLILKEAARFPSEGMSAGAFRHGPIEMVGDDSLVLVMEGDPVAAPMNRRLVEDVRRAGGRAAMIGPDAEEAALKLPRVPSAAAPLLEALPMEMVSLALAARRGLTPGAFRHATKVTLVE